MSKKILQIMYSDYGSEHTMGIRLFHINKNNTFNYKTICRSSIVKDNKIITTSPLILFIGKALSLLIKKSKLFRPLKGFDLFLFKKQVKKYITDDIDIIHLFNAYPDIIDYAHSKGLKVIVEGFTHPLYIQNMFENGIKMDRGNYIANSKEVEYYKSADYVISPSTFVTKTLLFANVDQDEIIEIPYGVQNQENKIYKDQEKLTFLFAGGVKRTKGFVELIESWIESGLSDKKDCQLVICGRVYNSNISKEYEEAKKIQNVKFRGFVKNMSQEYRNADIYIYPTYHEGSSKTVFEAMSYGLPIVTTENSGSIVRDDIDGFIVPVNDTGSLVEKIKFFYKNKVQIEKMGKDAQKYSREFTWELYCKRVKKVYEKVLNGEN